MAAKRKPQRLSQDEFGLIERYFARDPRDPGVILGIGDDAAVVETSGATAVATDTLVAGVHFPTDIEGDAVGHRVLAVNLSDFAAMGARPRWCTLALTLQAANHDWLEAFAQGFFALAESHDVELVGGDTTRGPLSVTVQLLGDVDKDRMLRRSGGAAGDDVYVTGSLGDGAAGLQLVSQDDSGPSAAHKALRERFLRPQPRVAEGLALRGIASAAIDVSDGLLADLGHLSRASGCGACIDVDRLPTSAAARELFSTDEVESWALSGGDDYELCFTAPPSRRGAVQRALASCTVPARRIGHLQPGSGVLCRRAGQPMDPPVRGGFVHFGDGSGA